MLSRPYYHGLIKKYVIIFGSLFNNITIEREDANGNAVQSINVPIAYGPRDKYISRIRENASGIASHEIILPIMSFNITNIEYDPDRKLQTSRQILDKVVQNGKTIYNKNYTPVAYNFHFTLSIMTKSTEDGTRIVEQILPYFTPEWSISARLIDELPNNITDIPIVIQAMNMQDDYDDSFNTRRTLVFNLDFVLKGYLYGPTTEAKLIRQSNIRLSTPTDLSIDVDIVPPLVLETVRPGLDANGNPTTLSANSIPLKDIKPEDNYGFITTIEEF